MNWHQIIKRGVSWTELEAEQASCIAQVKENPDNAFLLISEPTPTFTSGLSADPKELLWNPTELEQRQIRIHRASRGGKWTFHGPGQIVLYPILRLDRLGYDRRAAHRFLNTLRAGVVECLDELDISSTVSDAPFGVFCSGQKLVSFGIGIQRGVVSHGLALYYKDQNPYFVGIHPCGVVGGRSTSLVEQGVSLSWTESAERLAKHVKKSFKSH